MLKPSAALAATAIVLAACGSASGTPPTSPHVPATPSVVTVTGATTTTTTVKVGQLVEVVLTSHSYGFKGKIVPWGTPTSSSSTILAPTSAPRSSVCPPDSVCTYFAAHTPGSVTIRAVGPSGILCTKSHTDCVGVTALLRQLKFRIVAA